MSDEQKSIGQLVHERNCVASLAREAWHKVSEIDSKRKVLFDDALNIAAKRTRLNEEIVERLKLQFERAKRDESADLVLE